MRRPAGERRTFQPRYRQMATPYYARANRRAPSPEREREVLPSPSLSPLPSSRPRTPPLPPLFTFSPPSPRPTVAIHGFLPTVSLPVSPPSAHVSSRCRARCVPLAPLPLSSRPPPFQLDSTSDEPIVSRSSAVVVRVSCASIYLSRSRSPHLASFSLSLSLRCCHEFLPSLARVSCFVCRRDRDFPRRICDGSEIVS